MARVFSHKIFFFLSFLIGNKYVAVTVVTEAQSEQDND